MHLQPATLLTVSLCGYVVGAGASLLFMRREKLASFLAFGLGSLSALGGGLAALLFLNGAADTPEAHRVLLPALIPNLTFTVRLDALGAFFLLLVSLLGLAISIYSLGYARGFFGRKNVGVLGAFFNALLLSTTLVFLADNIWFFLVAWELMALTAYCLVSFEHEKPETRQAGVIFFVMSHIDAGCIILGFLLLFQASGDYSFTALRDIGSKMSRGSRDAAFHPVSAGIRNQVGHRAAPRVAAGGPPRRAQQRLRAHVRRALSRRASMAWSGSCFEFLGPPPLWWGVTLLTVGTLSALLGVLYALMEHDLKRLLAYHSIENIGIILMGLGASLMFLHTGHPMLAALALLAGLYHTINHAAFKALLFLGRRRRLARRRTPATWRKWAGWPSACRRRRSSFSSARWPSPPCRRSTASSANG